MIITLTRRNFNHHLSADDVNYETQDEIMLNTRNICLIEKNGDKGCLIHLINNDIISVTENMDMISFKLI